MQTIPIYMNCQNKKALVIGGGKGAAIKVKTFLDFLVPVTVVAPEISREIEELATGSPLLTMVKKKWDFKDLQGYYFIVCAAGEEVSRQVYQHTKKEHCICLLADCGEGDFILPAYKKNGSVTVTAGTEGKFPLLGGALLQEITMPDVEQVEYLASVRRRVLAGCSDKAKRRKLLKECLEDTTSDSTQYRTKIEERLKEENL